MDWLLSPATPEAGSELLFDFGAYLRRHCADLADLAGAALVVSELLANAVDHAGGLVWVSVDWTHREPILTVHDLGPAFDLDLSFPDVAAERGRGLWLVS